MYLPEHFAIDDESTLLEIIDENPLATLVTIQRGALVADHIPLLLERRQGAPYRLIGHVARSNDLWRDHDADATCLAIFSPAHAYISPNWYPSKQEHHRVVPTWNYVSVQASGPLVVHDDPKWTRSAVGKLTKRMEAIQPLRWKMADAPVEFVRDQLDHIAGIEIAVERLVGKAKASQNRDRADHEGAITGLRADTSQDGSAMATFMEQALSDRD